MRVKADLELGTCELAPGAEPHVTPKFCDFKLEKKLFNDKGKNAGVRPPLTLTLLPYPNSRLRTSPSELGSPLFLPSSHLCRACVL